MVLRLLLLAMLIFPALAAAHNAGLSVGHYAWRSGELSVTIALSGSELNASLPRTLRREGSWTALLDQEPAVRRWVDERIAIRADEAPCAGGMSTLRLDGDGLTLGGVWRCSAVTADSQRLTVEATFLAELPSGHRHLAEVRGTAEPHDVVLSADRPSFTAPLVTPPSVHPWALATAAAIVVVGAAASWAARPGRSAR